MQDSTRKILADADKLWRRPYRMLSFLGGTFKVDYNMIRYKLEMISLNNVDMDCEQEDIFTGPFTIRFDKEINLEKGNIKECEWNENDKILKINDEELKYLDTDLVYFTGDLNADTDEALTNLMNYFCIWVKKEYM